MGLTDRVSNAWKALSARDQWPTISWDDYASLVSFNSNAYLVGGLNQTIKGNAEEVDYTFAGLVQQAYKSNGVVFACMLARMQLFTEARFQFQELRGGRPGKLYGSAALDILEHPWTNGVTADFLARAITDADLAGNSFTTRRNGALRRLRPDWVTIVLGSERDPEVEAGDIDAEVLGYIYHPGGKGSGRDPEGLLRSEVAHFAPIPDPLASFRGMSWLTPVTREIAADSEMTSHKRAYLQNGATPNLVVSLDKDSTAAANPGAFKEWIEAFQKLNPSGNQWDRYKTMYLAGGTTVTRVGSDLGSTGIDFKSVQGAGETRIAAAAGVPPVIVGLSEGLQAATYSNYGQARRRFADNTMRPLWRNMAGSLETLVPPPSGSRLWYDDRDIQALAEDKKDLAEVRQLESQQIRTLTDAGFTPESVIEAVSTGDFTRLTHTGLFSVQLQPPGTPPPTPPVAQIPAVIPKREELLIGLMRALAARPVEARMVIEPGAIVVNSPPVTFEEGAFRSGDTHIATPDVNVTVEPAQVNIHEGAVQTTVEPAQLSIERIEVIEHVPTRTVIDRDEAGKVIGDHEEPIE